MNSPLLEHIASPRLTYTLLEKIRVGNSLFRSSLFCSLLFRSCGSFKKSDAGANCSWRALLTVKSDGSDSLLLLFTKEQKSNRLKSERVICSFSELFALFTSWR